MPSPNVIRPFDNSSTSAAELASSNGERLNPAARPVHNSARVVLSADVASIVNGL